MNKRRTKAQWLSLIEEFEQSGLTQAEFCAQRCLNAKYFSLLRIKHQALAGSGSFVRAVARQPHTPDPVTVQYGAVTVTLPASNPQVIAQLVKALAA